LMNNSGMVPTTWSLTMRIATKSVKK
jgi:hypothetical protein